MDKEYIERGAAKALFNGIPPFVGMTGKCVQDMLDKVQVADVAVVKRGQWVHNWGNKGYCSICHHRHIRTNYCPNCGAKMDGENNG